MKRLCFISYPAFSATQHGARTLFWESLPRLIRRHGFEASSVDQSQLRESVGGGDPPACVLGWYWSVFSEISPAEYRDRAVKTAVLVDDVHYYDPEAFRLRRETFANADLLLLPGYTQFLRRPEYREFWHKAVRFPWAAPSACFDCGQPWGARKPLVLLSGADSEVYPLRQQIRESRHRRVQYLEHPGYATSEGFPEFSHPYVREAYYSYCAGFQGAIATSATPPLDYLVAKYFELPACGCLPFFEPNADLSALGFCEEEHYISIDSVKVPGVFDRLASPEAPVIAARAQEFVHRHHSDEARARQLAQIVQERLT